MTVEHIEDHLARICECGCVRFNLLKSGDVECDGCQNKQNIIWRETMKMIDGAPRRARIDLYSDAEKAIHDAVQAVEEAGANVLLTEAVVLLHRAQEKVADFVELDDES